MATLTNPINAQNIVDRFADYVVATANSGIVYGQNNRHIADYVSANMTSCTEAVPYTGTQSFIFLANVEPYVGNAGVGRNIGITGSNISATPITAFNVYYYLQQELYNYCKIRSIRVRLNIYGSGGNAGTRPTAGIVQDVTGVGNMAFNWHLFVGDPTPAAPGIDTGNAISVSNLETYFNNLRTRYNEVRVSSVRSHVVMNLCHASCHSNCHGSRGRR
jgi:hypothetical protein